MCTACSQLIKAIDAYIAKADDKLSDALKKAGFEDTKNTIKHIEELEEQLAEVFTEQSADFEDLLKKASDRGIDVEEVLTDMFPDFKVNDKTRDKLFRIFFEDFSNYIPKLANVYMNQLDPELVVDQISRKTNAWIESWSGELSELMELSSHDEIEGLLKKALGEGKSIDKLSREIMENGIRDEYYKARRAALTETLRAHSAAREESLQQCPAVENKQWVHSGGYRIEPRENHIKISGQIVPKNESFTLTGRNGITYHPQFPRDPDLPPEESINCHCIHRGVVNDEILGLDLDERKRLQQKAVEEMDFEALHAESESENKARAGINEDTVKCDWLKNKTAEERKRYFRSDSRWALFESGVIQNDADLEKLYKTVDTKYGQRKVFKSLTELKNDGIITVTSDRLEHSVYGTYKGKSKEYPNGRMMSGGHTYLAMKECDAKGIDYSVNKKFSNGVCLGNVPSSELNIKRNQNGQSWFPESWDSDKVLIAGTYTANKGDTFDSNRKIAVYDNVAVRALIYGDEISTICPDLDQDMYVEGVKIEND
ncbi:MAG: phage minor head protein [Porcipelethomonas sp.]